jgi:antitoxin component of RelBE/YafQ-DinJ toxin-antitoxin module
MPRSKNLNKQLPDTNVRVSGETHLRLKTLADMMGLSISDAVDQFIQTYAPEVEEEISRRQDFKRRFLESKTELVERNSA